VSDVVRAHVWVTGRVQGVWFREGCRVEAERAGISGWVRNLADGRVEAVFEGEAAAVERLVGWCRTGPPSARVRDLEVRREMTVGEAEFAIR
jgi:acylphosphatase